MLGALLLILFCLGGGAAALSYFSNNGLGNENEATPLTVVEEETTPTTTSQPTETATATITNTAVVVPDPPTPTATATPTATPAVPPLTAALGDTWLRPFDNMQMVYVPAGSFVMGSNREIDGLAASGEQPAHEVALVSFWLDQTEVTNGMFSLFVEETGYVTTAEEAGDGLVQIDVEAQVVPGTNWRHPNGPDSDIVGLDNYPVVQVSWFDAQAYCDWAGGGLPTEAQWEYAARGPESVRFPWGDVFDGNVLNYCDGSCPLPQSECIKFEFYVNAKWSGPSDEHLYWDGND
jgi:formylglycine-generating enzyme required for sulfatase activity